RNPRRLRVARLAHAGRNGRAGARRDAGDEYPGRRGRRRLAGAKRAGAHRPGDVCLRDGDDPGLQHDHGGFRVEVRVRGCPAPDGRALTALDTPACALATIRASTPSTTSLGEKSAAAVLRRPTHARAELSASTPIGDPTLGAVSIVAGFWFKSVPAVDSAPT